MTHLFASSGDGSGNRNDSAALLAGEPGPDYLEPPRGLGPATHQPVARREPHSLGHPEAESRRQLGNHHFALWPGFSGQHSRDQGSKVEGGGGRGNDA